MTTAAVQAKERPILFSAPMVRAIRDGLKTQTRRVVKFKPLEPGLNLNASSLSAGHYCTDAPQHGWVIYSRDGRGVWHQRTKRVRCPYGQPGDRLWVREAWAMNEPPSGAVYRADGEAHHGWPARWKPSIHMPRWASRTTLEITGVRVERVQDISLADAEAEGYTSLMQHDPEREFFDAISYFARRWDALNKKRGFGWDVNPWVWAVTFKGVGVRW